MTRDETQNIIAIMQAYADGAQIEVRTPGSRDCSEREWTVIEDNQYPSWDWSRSEYRIAVQKPSIDWSHVSPLYNFLAVDDDEYAHLYQHKPFIRHGDWEDPTDRKVYAPRASTFASYKRGDCDWRESLVERPEGV